MKRNTTTPPINDYDTAAWNAFYAANPGFIRSVGAAGDNDDDTKPSGDDTKPKGDNDTKPKGGDDAKPKDDGPTDAEAALLKDLMKHKTAASEAKSKLSVFDGVDVEEYKRLKADADEAADTKRKADEQSLLDKGEFDKVREQMVAQHETEIQTLRDEASDLRAQLGQRDGTINNLTVGASFSSSKFIAEETIFTGSKARRLYEDHFDVVDGAVVGYDKPRGVEGRVQLVDQKGIAADFETSMRRIIEADPEKDDLIRSKMRSGAESKPGAGGNQQPLDVPKSSREKISDGLKGLMDNIETPSVPGFDL